MDLNGISLEENHTFCPGAYLGAGMSLQLAKRWFRIAVRWRAETVLDQTGL